MKPLSSKSYSAGCLHAAVKRSNQFYFVKPAHPANITEIPPECGLAAEAGLSDVGGMEGDDGRHAGFPEL
jgi:hypothetical protein